MKLTKLMSWTLSLAVVFSISACGGNSSNKSDTASQGSDKAVEITWYLHNQEDEEMHKLNDTILANFEKKFPNIKIKTVYNADPDSIVKTQLAAGAGPDIVLADGPTTLKQYAAAGYLLPLDEYSKQYGWENRFEPWAYNAVKNKDGLMGLPGSNEGLVLYYNKDMFKENGWTLPGNYEELMKLSSDIQAKGIIPIAFGTSDFKAANEWWLSTVYNSALGRDGFKKVLTGETLWNSATMLDATQKYVDLWQKGYINKKQSGAIKIDDATSLFLSGKAAMKLEGTWLLSGIISKKPSFDWGLALMPSWNNGVQAALPFALGDATGINKKTKHPEAVATFLDYMNSPEVIQMRVPTGEFYPLKDLKVESIPDLDPHVMEAYNLLKNASENNQAGFAAWTYWPPSVETYAWDNIESVLYGKLGVKEYLDKTAEIFSKDKADGNLFDFGS